MPDFITFYLPQFHPIPENDKWYGKGFTEWTNVAKAKPLFRGHYQPHIPADLGFYDLRVPEIRRQQAEMAKQYGISAFIYWHYWFGNGKQLLTMPIWELYKDKSVDFPFCLAWANHSWEKKTWDTKGGNELIAEQTYPGTDDYINHFYTILPLLKDNRYYRVGEKLLFLIYAPLASQEIRNFITTWRQLAEKEGIGEFFFVGQDNDCRSKKQIMEQGLDAVYDDNTYNIHHRLSYPQKVRLYIQRKYLKMPTRFKYKDAINYVITENSFSNDVIPVINPNWDHSPRSGCKGIMLDDCDPKYFYELVNKAIKAVEGKEQDRRIIIIKSWNEWGEGNHLEPDLKYGRGYLEALKSAIDNTPYGS